MARPFVRGLRGWPGVVVGAVLVLLTAAAVLIALGHGPAGRAPPPRAAAPPASASPGPSAAALLPATDWLPVVPPGVRIEGFADRTSVPPGGRGQLRVRGTGRSFAVTAFQIGDYGGTAAARAWHGGPLPLVPQPAPSIRPGTRTVVTAWTPSATVIAAGWPPGAYLLRLESDDGAQSLVPLTVRSTATAGRVVLVQAVTTWQAYNDWGGSSLYRGPDGQPASRSYAVSFDRP
jgi:hypothetical protein